MARYCQQFLDWEAGLQDVMSNCGLQVDAFPPIDTWPHLNCGGRRGCRCCCVEPRPSPSLSLKPSTSRRPLTKFTGRPPTKIICPRSTCSAASRRNVTCQPPPSRGNVTCQAPVSLQCRPTRPAVSQPCVLYLVSSAPQSCGCECSARQCVVLGGSPACNGGRQRQTMSIEVVDDDQGCDEFNDVLLERNRTINKIVCDC